MPAGEARKGPADDVGPVHHGPAGDRVPPGDGGVQPHPAGAFGGRLRAHRRREVDRGLRARGQARHARHAEVSLPVPGHRLRLRGLRRGGPAAGHGARRALLPLEGLSRRARPRRARAAGERPTTCGSRSWSTRGRRSLNRDVHISRDSKASRETLADQVRKAATAALARGERFDEKAFKDSEATVKKRAHRPRLRLRHRRLPGRARRRRRIRPTTGSRSSRDLPRSSVASPSWASIRDGKAPRRRSRRHPLRRTIDIKEGTPYSTAEIDSATQALLDLDVFSAVEIVPSLPQPPPPDAVVPLTVKVTADAAAPDHARRRRRARRDQDGRPPRRRLGGPQLPRGPARLQP